MKRIAVISDTHGLLRDEVKEQLIQSDYIIHAGDADTPALLQDICGCGEAFFVRGNNDKEWAEGLPQNLTFMIDGIRFFLVHNRKDVPDNLSGVDVIIYGHSHKYTEEWIDGVLWINPGSCGRRRFNLDITMCVMKIKEGRYEIEKITIL
ncbi:metallophosphoesterase [Anaerolentibacter hominis]|uniref:metallophosphoesterase family protein n=1 Tax=Anaerolentibacter hominis TaxID=3079009 RepID=UPI0031B827F7